MRRRLFQGLEEGVPGVDAEHVNFVDDEDFKTIARGPVRQAFLKLPHIVDAGVARGVDLLNVDIVASRDLDTGRAYLTGLGRWAALAIQGFRENARTRCFADAPHTRKQESMGNTAACDSILDRGGDVLLANEVFEGLRAVLACKNDVAHTAGPARSRSQAPRR